ncbi:MAG: mechanosensitive ion channel domain-containing protein [Chlamydiota bacterium]
MTQYIKIILLFAPLFAISQENSEEEMLRPSVQRIEVTPTAGDREIEKRLAEILDAAGWFIETSVQVKKGIVFLSGKTKTDEFKNWAGGLARNTQNVVAVVNKIEVIEPSLWDFTKALRTQWQSLLHKIPSILLGAILLLATWPLAYYGAKYARTLLRRKFPKSLLEDVIARATGLVIFLIGVYFIFEMANLTGAALAILSGTGLLGIILGIAFREITENFLASILLSVQHPFHAGDLIEIEGFVGHVQLLTMRVTILMSLEGHQIQIPNAIVYKSNIRNYTSNPNLREEFTLNIGCNDSISKAQEIALNILETHEAVLKTPEPWALVDSLAQGAITLRIYFWLNGRQHSPLKVRSSLLGLLKQAFQDGGISLSDGPGEVIFPRGISVQMLERTKVLVPCKEPIPAEDSESTPRSKNFLNPTPRKR